MTDADTSWQRAQDVFERLLLLPPAVRDEALATACGDDPAVMAEVRALLRGHRRLTTDFLEPPPAANAAPDGADLRIGGHRLLRLLGEGGMGTVWLAEDPALGRQVALKLLHRGLFGAGSARRFLREAAALARLRHPGIATVFAFGRRADDPLQPAWLVLELVAGGVPITVMAERRQATRRQRLEWLVAVADAIQHAHSRGVVHRDLKPANVLVGDEGVPKVIDFGIARLLDADPAGRTRWRGVLGTPAYLSPEQCAGDPDLVDARTDVHGLGVLAIELLTGRLPYDVADRPLTEALLTVRMGTPARPLALQPDLGRDLDAVLGKAIRKDPAERHPTAAAFADDLRAVLAHRPVSAAPAGLWRSLRLWVRRSPALAAALLTAGLAVIAGGLLSATFAVQAGERAAVAEREQQVAQQLADSLRDIIASGNLVVTGRDVTMREALDAAARAVAPRLAQAPAVAVEMHLALGDAYRVLGRADAAEQQFRLAEAALPAIPGDHRGLEVRLGVAWGALLAQQDRAAEADARMAAAVRLAEAAFGAGSRTAGVTRARRGSVLIGLRRFRDGREELLAARALLAAAPPDQPFAELLANLGNACFQLGDVVTAEREWRAAVDLFVTLGLGDHPHCVKTKGTLANVVRFREPRAALAMLHDVVAAMERFHPQGHGDVAQARSQLAFALLDAGEATAEAEFRRVVELRRALPGARGLANARIDLGYCLLALDQAAAARAELEAVWPEFAAAPATPEAMGCAVLLGTARTRTGAAVEAEPMLRAALAGRTTRFGADNLRTHSAASALAECLTALGRAAEAEPLLVAALAGQSKALGEAHRDTVTTAGRLQAARAALAARR